MIISLREHAVIRGIKDFKYFCTDLIREDLRECVDFSILEKSFDFYVQHDLTYDTDENIMIVDDIFRTALNEDHPVNKLLLDTSSYIPLYEIFGIIYFAAVDSGESHDELFR